MYIYIPFIYTYTSRYTSVSGDKNGVCFRTRGYSGFWETPAQGDPGADFFAVAIRSLMMVNDG